MGLNIASQLEAINTFTGNQTITISSFGGVTPVGAQFIWTRAAAADDHAPHAGISIGWFDGTRSRCMGSGMEDSSGTMDTDRLQSDASCGVLALSSAIDSVISGVSFGNNSVTINVDNAPPSGFLCLVTLFGGTDIANFYTNHFDDLGTGTSAVPITQISTDTAATWADLVLMTCISHSTAITGDDIHDYCLFHFGAWSRDHATNMMCAITSENGATAANARGYFDSDKITGQAKWDTVNWLASCSAHADGFQVTPTANAGNDIVAYAAIEWDTDAIPDIEIVESTLPSSAADWEESGFSFPPEFGLVCMSDATVEATQTTSGDVSMTVAAIQSGQVLSAGIVEEDAAPTSITASWAKSNFYIGDPDATNAATQGTLQSLDSDGWTMDISGDHDSVARKGWSLAIKAFAAPAGGPPAGSLMMSGMGI